MAKQVYWLSDAEWRRIEPLLPRGRKGAHRVDDRRVISGIMHMLKSGSRWRDCPEVYGPLHDGLQPLQPLEPTRDLDGHFLRADRIVPASPPDRCRWIQLRQSPSLCSRCKGGLQQCNRPLARRSRPPKSTH